MKPRIKVPQSAAVGEIIEIKTLVSHVMETGQRKDTQGRPIPRDIINLFTATYGGQTVFTANLHPGISANPYLAFYLRVPGAGDLVLTWTDDAGKKTVEKVALNVTG